MISGASRPYSSMVRTVNECWVIAASHHTSSPNPPPPTWPGVTVQPTWARSGTTDASGIPNARSLASMVNRAGNGGEPGSEGGKRTAFGPLLTPSLPRAQPRLGCGRGSHRRPGVCAGSPSVPAPPSVSQ
jgi:hypothetical protein